MIILLIQVHNSSSPALDDVDTPGKSSPSFLTAKPFVCNYYTKIRSDHQQTGHLQNRLELVIVWFLVTLQRL